MQFHYSVCWRSSSPTLAQSLKLEIMRRSYRIRFRYSGLYQVGGLYFFCWFFDLYCLLACHDVASRAVGWNGCSHSELTRQKQ